MKAKDMFNTSAFFCDTCVGGGKVGRLAKKTATKLAKRFGHGPVKRWRRGPEVTNMLNRSRDEEPVNSAIFNKRGAFLSFCCGNHLQFDTLRRAKYSSMIILNLLNRCVEGKIDKDCDQYFVRYCNFCRLPIVKDCRWFCPKTPDFDVCNDCKVNKKLASTHSHTLKKAPVMNSSVFQWGVLKEPDVVRNKKIKPKHSKSTKKVVVVKKAARRYRSSSHPVYSALAR